MDPTTTHDEEGSRFKPADDGEQHQAAATASGKAGGIIEAETQSMSSVTAPTDSAQPASGSDDIGASKSDEPSASKDKDVEQATNALDEVVIGDDHTAAGNESAAQTADQNTSSTTADNHETLEAAEPAHQSDKIATTTKTSLEQPASESQEATAARGNESESNAPASESNEDGDKESGTTAKVEQVVAPADIPKAQEASSQRSEPKTESVEPSNRTHQETSSGAAMPALESKGEEGSTSHATATEASSQGNQPTAMSDAQESKVAASSVQESSSKESESTSAVQVADLSTSLVAGAASDGSKPAPASNADNDKAAAVAVVNTSSQADETPSSSKADDDKAAVSAIVDNPSETTATASSSKADNGKASATPAEETASKDSASEPAVTVNDGGDKAPPAALPEASSAGGVAEPASNAVPSQTLPATQPTDQLTSPSHPQPPLTSPPLPSKQATLPPPPVPGKTSTPDERNAVAKAFGVQSSAPEVARSPSGGIRIGKGPPPSTNPEEEKPFDFNTFLEQMKDPSARGVGEYVRSFIRGFSKKPYRTADQIKLIFDFLDFISERMRQCAVWARLSEADFENAREAMEKLVMNRLYTFTFTPAVAKEARWAPQTDDLERDRVLRQRIELFSWLSEEHLDVPTGDHSRGFVDFAIQELLKINHYKAPRDKLICILNCCKVIFGLIRHMSEEENADTFIPVLIFVVLKANPEHLISNVEYIGRFRNPEKLSSESGYYLSSLMGATAFIETMDYSSLSNITQEEFEKNVEEAVAKMAARPPPPTPPMPSSSTAAPQTDGGLLAPPSARPPTHNRTVSASDPHAPLGVGEGSATNLPGPAPSNPNAASFADDTRAFLQRTGEAARLGFSTSLGKPIGALGKLLGEGIEGIKTPGSGPNSSVATPARVDSPALNAALKGEKAPESSGTGSSAPTPRRGGVFSSLFGGEPSSPTSRTVSGNSSTSTGGGFNPGSWGRTFRGNDAGSGRYDDDDEYDDDDGQVPQTPMGTDNRQGPFSSLVRNPKYSDAAPPARRIGQTPYAPKAARNRPPPPERSDSLDPFNSPDVSGGSGGTTRNRTTSSALSHRADSSDDIGTPSDDDDDDADESRSGVLRRLPDLGAFVPSFLSEREPTSSPRLTRGPNQAQPAFLGESSLPASEADVDAEIERVQEEQMAAAVETLRSVFPETDDEVRRMVLEACDGDVAQAIDRLLEMMQG